MFRSAIRAIVRRPLEAVSKAYFAGPGTCLTYHRICADSFEPPAFSPNLVLYVPLQRFERQIRYLAENYECLSLDDLVERLAKGTLGPRSVAVTFDDGYRDNLDLALPVLKKYNVPATIYLTTGLMDGSVRSLWWETNEAVVRKLERIKLIWDGRLLEIDCSTLGDKRRAFALLHRLFMTATPETQYEAQKQLCQQAGLASTPKDPQALSWDEVVRLDKEPLITLGAHSVSHAVLKQLSREDLERELGESKRVLEQRLGHPVTHLAYPFGDRGSASAREFSAARACGYVSAVTTRLGHIYGFHARQPFSLPRITVAYGDDFEHFTWKLAGLESLFKRPTSRFFAEREES